MKLADINLAFQIAENLRGVHYVRQTITADKVVDPHYSYAISIYGITDKVYLRQENVVAMLDAQIGVYEKELEALGVEVPEAKRGKKK